MHEAYSSFCTKCTPQYLLFLQCISSGAQPSWPHSNQELPSQSQRDPLYGEDITKLQEIHYEITKITKETKRPKVPIWWSNHYTIDSNHHALQQWIITHGWIYIWRYFYSDILHENEENSRSFVKKYKQWYHIFQTWTVQYSSISPSKWTKS